MSVLIKDMEMPKSCKSCDLLQDYDGDMYCPLNTDLNFGDIENVPDYVMIGCPLSEVPKRKRGKWIKVHEDIYTVYKCSECGHKIVDKNPPFCEMCGADIREETEDAVH